MARTFTSGTLFSIASTYASSVTMSALTNAAEAVATLGAAHGVVVGDYIELTSGWGRLNGRIVRVKTVVTNDVTLEGINTVSTSLYPAGQGVGSIRRITAWTNLSQVRADGISSSGGEQQFIDITEVDDEDSREAPTVRSPQRLSLVTHDDISLPWYATVLAADEAKSPVGFRATFRNGSKLVANAIWSIARVPQIGGNDVLKTPLSLAFSAQPVRYAT
jgi:hypothetical protein